ncbi:MAG: hypothetical protein OHK0039_20610 [Bacteroidia bacterium]
MNAAPRVSPQLTSLFLALTFVLIAAFDVFAYLRPDLFSEDGSWHFFYKVIYFIGEAPKVYALLGAGIVLVLVLAWWRRAWVQTRLLLLLQVLCGLWLLFLSLFALVHFINIDELEAIQTTWKMAQGARPYTDFFQHHHPLLWYQSLPAMWLLGPSETVFYALRLVQLLYLLGILALSYRLVRQGGGDRETGYVAVLVLATAYIFTSVGVEIRPDIAQTFFCLLGYTLLLRYLAGGSIRLLVAGGASMAAGFLFLQKALFMLFPMGLAILYLLATRRLTWRDIFVFAGGFVLPVLLFLAYYLLTGQGETYLVFAWIVNFFKTAETRLYVEFVDALVWNPYIWVSILLTLPYMVLRFRHLSLEVKMTWFVGAVLLFIVLLNPRAWRQYYFPAFPLLVVPAAFMVIDLTRHWRAHIRLTMYVLLAASAFPIYAIDFQYTRHNQYILGALRDSAQATDTYAFDEMLVHNVFRRDLHYFWYTTQPGGMMDAYHAFAAGDAAPWFDKARYDDFDFCTLVERYAPEAVYGRAESPHQVMDCPAVAHHYEVDPRDTLLYRRVAAIPVTD